MGKKIRISDESVNCYGTRILTSGIDYAQYAKNPVLLYMHERSYGVVGLVKNLHVEDNELLGELEFDCATELSQRLKKQYEFGSMRMVSGNFQVTETSANHELVADGQTLQTVTRCKLFEVSAVDIGGNDNALVLSSPEGETLEVKSEAGRAKSALVLPLLNNGNKHNNPLNRTEMELKTLALTLGLKETATEAEVTQKLEALKLASAKVETLTAENAALAKKQQAAEQAQEALQLAAITQEVERAVQEKRISAQKKDHFVALGKQVGIDSLKITLSAIQPQGKVTTVLHRTNTGQVEQTAEGGFGQYVKLSAVPASLMDDLIDNHHDEYMRLFKAEYGFDPE